MANVHGGRLVARALRRHGVEHLFTLCGGHIQAIYDGCLDEGIRVVDVRHEQTAGHAADAYSRVGLRPGVCAVTAGPGVTDVVTAVANAQRAGVPMICLGGAGPLALADMGSLQDMDAVGLMRSITKSAVRVAETRRIEEYVDAAFRIAQSGTPGPVFLELPLDVLMGFAAEASDARPPVPVARPGAAPGDIDQVAALLEQAERPMLIVGSELRFSSRPDALAEFLERVKLPCFVSGMARGALPAKHPSFFSRVRKTALKSTDLLIALGVPFDFRLDYGRPGTLAPAAKIVHVGIEAESLGKNRAVDVAVHSDPGLFLAALRDAMKPKDSPEWLATLRTEEISRQQKLEAEIAGSSDPPNPLRVCAEIGARLGPEDIVIGDGGDFVATAANVIPLAWPQLWMDPGPLGTLGIGPGFAMAAKLLRPNSRVVIVYGDGSFGLHALEFEALIRQKLPVVSVIGNDAAWMQIRRGQVQFYGEPRAVATGLEYTRYERVVEALGGKGFWVDQVSELGPALDAAFASDVASCVNVKLGASDFRKNAISV
jgi:acetolactate synthase-1/2/3 large subunit